MQVQKAIAMATLARLCELAADGVFSPDSDAVRSLRWLATGLFCPASSAQRQLLNRTLEKPDLSAGEAPALKDWGRLAARFVRDQWVCLCFLQGEGALEGQSLTTWFQAAIDALALLPSDLVLPVLEFMIKVLPQVSVLIRYGDREHPSMMLTVTMKRPR